MKKICFVALILLACVGAFAQKSVSKNGYFKLKWGTTVEDAKNAGYKLTAVSKEAKEEIQKKFDSDVSVYKVSSKDKNVLELDFVYYMGRFFYACESVLNNGSQSKLESRYGDFAENGIRKDNDSYTDLVMGIDGKANNLSIFITPKSNGTVYAKFMDWNVYKNLNISIKKINGQATNSIVEQFKSLAVKLLQDGKDGEKPSYAFLSLSSDNKNSAVESYVTDALTEAVFNTGKIKIIERANLEKILSEQKFQSSGLVNEDTAKEIGNLTGADFVCYGTLKDLGEQISVNARVVDVETGEICAMSRVTFNKDEYLKTNQNTSTNSVLNSVKSSSVKKTASTETKKLNTLWTVRKSRNDFDGYTTYTFILKGPQENKRIFVGYDKNDVESKSMVRSGFCWDSYNCSGSYDIKDGTGNTVTKRFSSAFWSYDTGWKDGNENFYFSYNKGESARFMLNLIQNNNFLTVRHRNLVQRFQTSGFWDLVEAQGITKEEIENAIANEEF